jgi:hypothetical protein
MKASLSAYVLIVAALLLAANLPAHAGPYGAKAQAHDSVTVSGSWSSVQWYESDGCYSGVGDPSVSDWKGRAQGNTPINLSTTASDARGNASSSIVVNAPLSIPTIVIHSAGDVHDVPMGASHWASAFSQGGANWLTSGATQSVTFTVDYRYNLDLTQAHPGMPYAFAKIYVAFWGPSGNLMLTPDNEFVSEGNYLVKEVRIKTTGGSTGTVTGSKSWTISVTNGGFYSFWSMAWAEAWTEYSPISVEPASWGAIKSLYR